MGRTEAERTGPPLAGPFARRLRVLGLWEPQAWREAEEGVGC